MANSPFQKVKIALPVAVNKGGTGVGFLNDEGVLVGAGTNGVGTISPGATGNVLVSDGTSWTSGTASIDDETVTYEKLASDLVGIVAMSTNDVDWSSGAIFTKTLTGNTTLTFSNYLLDKNIFLEIDGNFTLNLPASVNIVGGEYVGTATNYIKLHCTNATGGSEEVWAIISQSTA